MGDHVARCGRRVGEEGFTVTGVGDHHLGSYGHCFIRIIFSNLHGLHALVAFYFGTLTIFTAVYFEIF